MTVQRQRKPPPQGGGAEETGQENCVVFLTCHSEGTKRPKNLMRRERFCTALRMTSVGATLPLRRYAVDVVPILIGGIGRLRLAVVIAGGIGEVVVIITNTDLFPFLRRAGVVNRCQARAADECIATNAFDAIGDGDACKARAAVERIVPNACDANGDGDACKARAGR